MESVRERQSARWTATLRDEDGIAVAAAALTTATLTLKNQATGAVINGRNAQNVKNANNVTIDAAGLLTWAMQPADNAIVVDGTNRERHVAVFEFTWGGGSKQHWEAIVIEVEANPA